MIVGPQDCNLRAGMADDEIDTRDKPLFTALDNGIQSVEADIWWRDNKLLVSLAFRFAV